MMLESGVLLCELCFLNAELEREGWEGGRSWGEAYGDGIGIEEGKMHRSGLLFLKASNIRVILNRIEHCPDGRNNIWMK